MTTTAKFKDDASDCDFEEKFSKTILGKIASVKDYPGNTDAERVEAYLSENSEDSSIVLLHAYEYIKKEGITHYVNQIELGACMYTRQSQKFDNVDTKLGGGIAAHGAGSLGGSFGTILKDYESKCNFTSIGDIRTVTHGKGENVVGYWIQPLDRVFQQEKLKNIFSKAIESYLNRESMYYSFIFNSS